MSEKEALEIALKKIQGIGFQCSEVAGACDILESGGEVSKPSHLQIKYTANQDFGKNPNIIVSQNSQKIAESSQNFLDTKDSDDENLNDDDNLRTMQ